MSESKFTPGPWRWQGEGYRGGWGWQMLVGPNGEGLVVGQDALDQLKAFMPLDPSLCITGLAAKGKRRVQSVYVFSEANARLIAAAPDLYDALAEAVELFAANNKMPLPTKIRAALAKAGGESA